LYKNYENGKDLKGGAVAKKKVTTKNLFRDNFTIKKISTLCNNTKKYVCEDGVLFNSDKTVLLKYAINNKNTKYEIPNSVTTIGSNAFDGCRLLETIIIPNSVTTIGDYAFFECSSLKTIIIPDSVISIGEFAFGFCSKLKKINIPDSVISIGEAAFQLCYSLNTISISRSLKLTKIENSAFSGLESLTSFTIPDSVTIIEICAFQACESLKSITIPSSVTSIGQNAFSDCSSLTTIVIPSNLITNIKVSNVFSGCKLTNIQDEKGRKYEIEGTGKNSKFVLK